MGNSKAIRHGNTTVVKIPEALAVAGNKKFYLHRSDDGEVLLVPKIRDYFEDAKDGEYTQHLEWEDIYIPQGKETIE